MCAPSLGNVKLISLSDAVKIAVDAHLPIPGSVIQVLSAFPNVSSVLKIFFFTLMVFSRDLKFERLKVAKNMSYQLLYSSKYLRAVIFVRGHFIFFTKSMLWVPCICFISKITKLLSLASTCGNSTACACYLNWKPVDPPPPQQTDGPVGKAATNTINTLTMRL